MGIETSKFREYVMNDQAENLLLRMEAHIRKAHTAWLMKGFEY